MSHFWPREKNWSTETRKKVVLVWFTNRGLGNGFCDTSGDQCQIKRALFLHMVSCGRISCQCTESEKQSMIIFVCFLLGNSPASELCVYIYIYINIYIYIYTGCPRRNVPDFGRVFLMLKYTDITQNTYVQS